MQRSDDGFHTHLNPQYGVVDSGRFVAFNPFTLSARHREIDNPRVNSRSSCVWCERTKSYGIRCAVGPQRHSWQRLQQELDAFDAFAACVSFANLTSRNSIGPRAIQLEWKHTHTHTIVRLKQIWSRWWRSWAGHSIGRELARTCRFSTHIFYVRIGSKLKFTHTLHFQFILVAKWFLCVFSFVTLISWPFAFFMLRHGPFEWMAQRSFLPFGMATTERPEPCTIISFSVIYSERMPCHVYGPATLHIHLHFHSTLRFSTSAACPVSVKCCVRVRERDGPKTRHLVGVMAIWRREKHTIRAGCRTLTSQKMHVWLKMVAKISESKMLWSPIRMR